MTEPFQPSVECADFQPLYDFVLVRRLHDETKWRGLHTPEQAQNAERGTRRGIVEKCGPGDRSPIQLTHDGSWLLPWQRIPMNVKPGDIVLYDRVPANNVRLNGVEYTLCHEEQHILAVLEPADFRDELVKR